VQIRKTYYNPLMPNFRRILIVVLLLLLIPFFGNIFVDGWNWTVGDFIGAFAVLFVVGTLVSVAAKIAGFWLRVAVIGVILLAFLFAWATVVADGETPGYVRAWQTIF
jgi:hypothetical protein